MALSTAHAHFCVLLARCISKGALLVACIGLIGGVIGAIRMGSRRRNRFFRSKRVVVVLVTKMSFPDNTRRLINTNGLIHQKDKSSPDSRIVAL